MIDLTYKLPAGIPSIEGEVYVDRGDPAAYDWTVPALIMNNAWQTLDLSGIVPAAGANRLVHLRVYAYWVGATRSMWLRMKGNANVPNAIDLKCSTDNPVTSIDGWIMTDAARHVEYKISAALTTVQITVAGWMEPAT